MVCPACNNELTEVQSGSVVVDLCRDGCGGIWFDRLEIRSVDEPHEEVSAALLDLPSRTAAEDPPRRDCPRCDRIVMMRRFASARREVAVDECPGCGGFWLDGGELERIRSEFRTESERKQAAERFLAEAAVAPVAARSAAYVTRQRNLTWILNLLCRRQK